jgi:hypothetical protein
MITTLSPAAKYRATCSDHDDGVFVVVRAASRGPRDPGTQLYAGVLDAPFHVVLDRVTDAIADLEDERDSYSKGYLMATPEQIAELRNRAKFYADTNGPDLVPRGLKTAAEALLKALPPRGVTSP